MDDPRREARHPVQIQGRYRTGKGQARDVIVKDLSTRGCRFIDRFCSLEADSYISLKIGSIGSLTARVRWVEGHHAGVEFEEAIYPSVLEHMRHSIEDWASQSSLPPDLFEFDYRRSASQTQVTEEPVRLLLRVRAATVDDVREILSHSRLSLPISKYEDLVEIFHRMLEMTAIEEEQEDKSGD